MTKEELIQKLESDGYKEIREIPGRGLCGLRQFMFTVGLCYGLQEYSFEGRWCYPHEYALEALVALKVWDGKEDPAGNWVKYKGLDAEYSNPKLK